MAAGESLRSIAGRLGRAASTVSRELAPAAASGRGQAHLRWSPEQISGWLRETYPGDEAMQVSHETIYLTLFIQARGGLKPELTQHLRTRRANRRPKGTKPPSGCCSRCRTETVLKRFVPPWLKPCNNSPSICDNP